MANKKGYELDIRIQGTLDKSLLDAVNKAKNEVKGLSGKIEAAAPFFESLETAGVKTFQAIGRAAVTLAPQVIAVTKHFTETGMAFEKQMSAVEAIAETTPGELADITEKARELGRQTVFTAEDIGKAMEYMAMAGWSAEEIQNGIKGVIDLTAASGEEAGTVSDIVTDALTAFGMTADQTVEFANVLAQASASSNTNVQKMGETFKYAAPIAGALGYSIQDTALAIGLMANQGIKASQAGTSLRTLMTEIAGGVEIMGKNIDAAKDGKMRPFIDVLKDMRKEFSGLNEQEKVAVAEDIGGKRGMTALLALMNASETDFNSLYSDILNAQESNAAGRMSSTRLDNLAGDVELFSDAVKDLELTIYDDMDSPLRDAVQWASGIVNTLNTKVQEGSVLSVFTDKVNSSTFQNITLFLQSTLNGAGEHGNKVISVLKAGSNYLPEIAAATAAWGAAVGGYKIISGVSKLVTIAAAAGPLAAGITVGAVAIGAVVDVMIRARQRKIAETAENLSEAFGDLSLNAKEVHDVVRGLLDDGTFDELDLALNQAVTAEETRKKVAESLKELEKYNFKLKLGIELTPEESATYKEQVLQAITDAQTALDEDYLQAKMAVSVVFGDSVSGQMIEGDLDDFYNNSKGTLEFYSQQLKDALNSAFADGLIDIDEGKTITGIMNSVKSISERLSTAREQASWEWLKSEYSGKELTSETFQLMQQEILNQTAEIMEGYEETYVDALAVMEDLYSDDPEKLNAEVNLANRKKLEKYAETYRKGFEFQLNTISDVYGAQIDAAFTSGIESVIGYAKASGTMTGAPGMSFGEALPEAIRDSLSSGTLNAVSELYSNLKPQVDELESLKESYINLGMEIPSWIDEGLEEADKLALISGENNETVIDRYVNPLYEEFDTAATELAESMQESIEEEVDTAAELAADNSWKITKAWMMKKFEMPIDVKPNLNFKIDLPVKNNTEGGPLNLKMDLPVRQNAEGGIYTSPILTTFAEEGAEAAIPLNGSSRAISLWMKAGEILSGKSRFQSAYDRLDGGSSGMNINYSPVITFTGTVSKEDVLAANRQAQQEFENRMNLWMKTNRRLSFA